MFGRSHSIKSNVKIHSDSHVGLSTNANTTVLNCILAVTDKEFQLNQRCRNLPLHQQVVLITSRIAHERPKIDNRLVNSHNVSFSAEFPNAQLSLGGYGI